MNDRLNIEEIIESGILEQYALGLTSAEESKMVLSWIAQSETLKSHLRSIQESLELYAQQYAQPVPESIKQNILKEIQYANQLQLYKKSLRREILRYSIVAALIFGSLAIYLWLQNDALKTNHQILIDELRHTQQRKTSDSLSLIDCQQRVEILRNKDAEKIILKGTLISPQSFAAVYYDSLHLKAYLDILQLPQAPQDKQYQLWAIVKGKPVDLGVFDIEKGDAKIKSIDLSQVPEAFAVTLEPAGGKAEPSLDQLYLIGALKAKE